MKYRTVSEPLYPAESLEYSYSAVSHGITADESDAYRHYKPQSL